MKTRYLLYILVLAMAMSSCVEKLDIDQMGTLSAESYYVTDDDAQEALAAVYNSWFYLVEQDYSDKVLLADDCTSGGYGPSDGGDRAGFSRAYFDVTCSLVENLYTNLYIVINRANTVLDNFMDAADTDIKQQAVAESRFFRAYCYMELVTLWGNPPLVTTVLTPAEAKVTNTPAEETWAFIETELQEIIDCGYLTEKASVSDSQAGIRPTKQTAQAYLGKAYLIQGKYSEALDEFQEVINSGLYALATGDDYGNLFHLLGNYSSEYILSTNTVQDLSNYFYHSWLFAILTMWNWGNSNFQVYDTDLWQSFCGGDIDTSLGYGFMHPTQKLADKFVEIEGKEGYRLNKTILSHDKMHTVVGAWLAGDSQHFEHVGWYRYKFLARKSDEWPYTQWLGVAINLPTMRYAELLLMAAEAAYKSNDNTSALNYFNQVRTRAQAPTVSSLDMDTIMDEFFVETCFEGHRYQDLQRWDANGDIDMTSVLADKGTLNTYFTTQTPTGTDTYTRYRTDFTYDSWLYYVPATETAAGFSDYEKLLPYPQAETDVNPNLVQNPGWSVTSE